MDDNAISEILGRLERIESKLDKFATAGPVPPPMTIPPVIRSEPARAPKPTMADWRPPVPPARALRRDDETEFMLGAKILPRLGAVVLAVMFIYFVSLAYDRGWIGPWSIFGVALAFCAILIAVGQRLRNEKEDFGQVLTGLGSCGTFLTFAGGQVYQHLFSGEILVALFVIWGFVNLGYGSWRGSKAHVGLGMLGGLVAAAMPLDQGNVGMAMGLEALAFMPAALLIARNQWRGLALLQWALAAVVAVAIGYHTHPSYSELGLAPLELTSLLGLAGFAWCGRKQATSIPAEIGAVFTYLTALGVMVLADGTLRGAEHVLAFGLLSMVVAWFAGDASERWKLVAGGLLAVVTICPFGVESPLRIALLVGLSAGFAAASFRWHRASTLAIAAIEGLLAMAAGSWYLVDRTLPVTVEVPLLLGLVAASVAGGVSGKRVSAGTEFAFFVAACALAGRVGYVGGSQWLEPEFALTAAILCSSLSALTLGFLRSNRELRVSGLVGLFAAAAKVLTFDLSEASPFARVGLLFGVGLALLGGGYWYILRNQKDATPRPQDGN